jgi:hypothetical protein
MARKKTPTYKKDDLIKIIIERFTSGVPQASVVQEIISMGYSTPYFYDLYREAKPLIQQALKGIAENRLETTIIEMETQYQTSLTNGDRRLANEIRKEINKISGLHQQKIDITTDGDKINNIQIIKLIEIKNNEDGEV